MDIGLAAAMMAKASEGDDRRYEGYAMSSALPGAPVSDDRSRVTRRLETWRTAGTRTKKL